MSTYLLFKPTNLIANSEDIRIVRLQCNIGGVLKDIQDFDEMSVLDYLKTCMKLKTCYTAESYSLGDVEISIYLRTDTVITHILLGKKNYCYNCIGDMKHEVLNAEMVKTVLINMLLPDIRSISLFKKLEASNNHLP